MNDSSQGAVIFSAVNDGGITMKRRHVFEGQAGVIAAIFAASLFVNLLLLTAPLYMIQLFTRVIGSGSLTTLAMLTLGAGIALLFHFLFDALRQRLVGRLGNRIEAGVGPAITEGLLRRANARSTASDAAPVSDLQEVRTFVTSPVFTALLDAPWSLVFVGVIWLFHPLLALVAGCGLALLATLGVLSEVLSRRASREAALAQQAANRSLGEMAQNAESILAMGKLPALLRRWQRFSAGAMVLSTRAGDRVSTLAALARLVRVALQIAVLATGVTLVLDGALSPGIMIATAILLGRAAAPVEQAIAGWRALVSARAARDRLNELLSEQQERDRRLPLPEPEGRLSVEGATLVSAARQQPLIFDVSFELEPGQSLGVVGPSGAGKTTLARALVGIETLTRGCVRIDGAALPDWPADQIGAYMGFLPQRVELMQGTVAENIAMMDAEADPAEVVAAARMAQVHELILDLPGGYNCEVGARGEMLSAGQRQRIGLARAFFGDKRLIVLDEPNANLDPAGEEALARAVEAATRAGRAVVVVTHRTAILRRVSHAAVMQEGRMIRFGPARKVLEALVRPVAAETTPEDATVEGVEPSAQGKVAPLRRRAAGPGEAGEDRTGRDTQASRGDTPFRTARTAGPAGEASRQQEASA